MPTSHVDIVRANFSRRQAIRQELAEIDEACTTDKRSYNDDEANRIESLRGELKDIDGRIEANLDMQVRSQAIESGIEAMLGGMVSRMGDEIVDARSLGQRFTEGEDYRNWVQAGANGKFVRQWKDLDMRAVTDVTNTTGSGGTLVRPERLPRIGQDFLDRKVYLADVVPHINVTNGTIEYVQDKTPLADMANKAVEVSEQGQKPQAGVTLQVVTEPTATIAVWANITRQVAQDVPQIQAYLDGRMRYSLRRRVDSELINGTGAGSNLKGLVNRSGILTNAPGGAEARYRTIRHSISLMEQNEAVPEIIVLNPADAEIFDLSNDTTAGLHVLTDAANDSGGELAVRPPRTAWGLTQVRSNAIASGTALLIDPMSLAIFDRSDVVAYITDSHASNFTANILTMLVELRAGLGLFDPLGVCLTTFNGTA